MFEIIQMFIVCHSKLSINIMSLGIVLLTSKLESMRITCKVLFLMNCFITVTYDSIAFENYAKVLKIILKLYEGLCFLII